MLKRIKVVTAGAEGYDKKVKVTNGSSISADEEVQVITSLFGEYDEKVLVVTSLSEEYDQTVHVVNPNALDRDATHPMDDLWDLPCPGCNETIARGCFVCNEVRLFGGEVKGGESIIAAIVADLRP